MRRATEPASDFPPTPIVCVATSADARSVTRSRRWGRGVGLVSGAGLGFRSGDCGDGLGAAAHEARTR
jgi:hypothetical protein